MPNPAWTGYPDRLWASNWYKVFNQNGVTDNRANLTWQNLFATLPSVTNVTNYYSSGDQILQNPGDNSLPSPLTLLHNGTLAWVAQEKLKGTPFLRAATYSPYFRDTHGGWGFNIDDWHKTEIQTAMSPLGDAYTQIIISKFDPTDITDQSVPTAKLAELPFFSKFQESDSRYTDPNGGHYDGKALLSKPGDSTGDAQGAYFPTEAKLFGEAIPSLSFAIGANPVAELNVGATNNFNLTPTATDTGFESGWPQPPTRQDTLWRHADYLDVAYTYVFPLFDDIVTKGALK